MKRTIALLVALSLTGCATTQNLSSFEGEAPPAPTQAEVDAGAAVLLGTLGVVAAGAALGAMSRVPDLTVKRCSNRRGCETTRYYRR